MKRLKVPFFFDYKSPYSYLAKDPIFHLQQSYNIDVDFLPYDFSRLQPNMFRPELRTEVDWMKIRYFYKDLRRFANERTPRLVIKGPKKLFDSSFANIGGLYCQEKSPLLFKLYTDHVFEKFFLRELDIGDPDNIANVIKSLSESCEIDDNVDGYLNYLSSEGNQKLREIEEMGDEMGVFGVPTVFVDGEMYFGNDRMNFVEKHLESLGLKKSDD